MQATTRAMRALGALGVVAMTVTLSGCADDPSDVPVAADAETADPASADAADAGATGVVVEVQALDNTFRADELTIAVGTEVVFANVGRNEHNVIPEPGGIQGWGVGEDRFAPGDTYAHVFTEPGVYEYVCTIHGVKRKGMVGTITVTSS
jgi:plastocyanin